MSTSLFGCGRRAFVPAAAVGCMLLSAQVVMAADYPSKPMTVVVTWPAGGGTDIAARTILKYVEKSVGQRIDVRNIAGGGGAIGYVQGAAQAADGYHLTTLQFDILSVEAQKLAPVSHRDFDTVAMFADQPVVLAVKGNSPYATLADFVKAAKANKLKVGGASIGGVWHQASHLMEKALGISYTYVPYEGITGVLPAILGGHIDAGVIFLSGTTGSMKSGDLRLLAVMSDKRLEAYPSVPTFAELGYKLTYAGFYGMAMPKGAPKEAIEKLAKAFEAACADPAYKAEANGRELDPTCLGPQKFREFLDSMYPKVESVSAEIVKK
ncbi:MAG: tripartite tricarboxylate transporter substrate binding protein [Hyphomicrobiaceae bacterium]|nr:tripartite tricarboxylate transporter substrate binding protein [Hyphomicrobiaceae bacterium]